jgi:hypothetical protein
MRALVQLAATVVAAIASAGASAGPLLPTPYASALDSPFAPASFGYFYLEDVEDNAINTPGLTVTGSGLCITGFSCFIGAGLTDSIGNGGDGSLGRSIWAAGPTGITLTFNAAALGGLPTAAGVVWTDGSGATTFAAYDAAGSQIALIVSTSADNRFDGTLADDFFYGATDAAGIARIVISNTSGGIEIDHIQYGGGAAAARPVSAPATLALLGLGITALALRRRTRA